MARYIEADALIKEYDRVHVWMSGGARKLIKNAPTADARENTKAKWQWLSSTYDRTPCEMLFYCSNCHCQVITHNLNPWEKFCPNCGADMRGESNDESGSD